MLSGIIVNETSRNHERSSSVLPWRRRLFKYLRRFVLSVIVIAAAYRGPIEYGLWRVRSVGGVIHYLPPQSWLYFRSCRYLPAGVTSSPIFRRLFWPAPVGLDLRAVADQADAHAAILSASDWPELRSVVLYRSGITDEDIKLLSANCHELTDLIANETAISNTAISYLHRLPRLRLVNIQRTSVDDMCVDDLLAIPRLKELLVGDTRITPAGMKRLDQSVPILRDRFVTKTRCKKCRKFLSYCECES